MARPNILELGEFDVTQRIIESLTNVCSRAVLFCVKASAKDATQIAAELDISISLVYKTLSQLEDLALVEIERFAITEGGKKIKQYRSTIGRVQITMNGTEPVLNLYPNR